ncbi:MAG TPA: non-canonical purine NTP pyrophosphatase, partial [Blastocatellia bacterium]|nr:non-canonical purine NTP pyrophosphatase [Blastocatellia bacterium]
MQVMLASANPAKILELKDILGQAGIEVIGLGDRSSTQEIETGSTFTENALLKARHYRKVSGLPTIADDSGLEVETLGGEPGVHSARYGGPGASDADRVNKLLDKLRNVPHDRRQCRF